MVYPEQPSRPSKVLVIGLDGATWDLFAPWMDEGLLPNLAYARRHGVWGELQSTTPPVTAPAWITFQTGVNPGKHGFFDFTRYQLGSYETPLLSTRDLALPTLWRILGDAGQRVIVINVPITYPPEPVNGLLVSGMMTPNTKVHFTYPKELAQELKQVVGDYHIFTPLRRVDVMGPRAFVDRLISVIQGRATAALHLIARYPWDFFMVHFQSTDVLQHTLYHYLDAHHPLAKNTNPRDRQHVFQFYRVLDELLGKILTASGSGTMRIVMSDHGFGPLTKRIYLNRLLAKEGLLAVRSGERGLRAIAATEAALRKLDVLKLRRRLLSDFGAGDQLARKAIGISQIDWARTHAFVLPGAVYGRVYVNRKGREAQGIVQDEAYEPLRDEIVRKLLAAIDPENGQPLFQQVLRREEVYYGPYLEMMPDLIAVPTDGYMITDAFRGALLVEPAPSMLTGSHRMNGLVMLAGEGVQQGLHITGATIADLAPTVLYVLGVPIPQYMDGAILNQAFLPSYLAEHPPLRQERPIAARPVGTSAYSEEETRMIEDRLKGLGYLD